MVCAHGDVYEYCREHGIEIDVRCECADLSRYDGENCVIVTDQKMTKNEYYYLKMALLRRKINLISIHHSDEDMESFVRYMNGQPRKKYGGRLPFGFCRDGQNPEEMKVVRRILELREAGKTYRQICDDEGVCYPDGRRLSLSVVRSVILNEGRYDRG